MVMLARLRSVRIVWTLHNVWEHTMRSRWQNAFLRWVVAQAAYRIVVMHEAIGAHVPRGCRHKVVVANFGTFRPAVERAAEEAEPNEYFARRFSEWKRDHGIISPDIVMISSMVPEADDVLAFLEQNPDVSALIIGPRVQPQDVGPNVFLYHQRVYAEVDEILRGEGIIGYFSNDNLSVPTAIYTFSAYGIPLIGKDVSPIAEILGTYNAGEVYTDAGGIRGTYDRIRADYDRYRDGCTDLITADTWEASAEVHREVFV